MGHMTIFEKILSPQPLVTADLVSSTQREWMSIQNWVIRMPLMMDKASVKLRVRFFAHNIPSFLKQDHHTCSCAQVQMNHGLHFMRCMRAARSIKRAATLESSAGKTSVR